MAAHDLGDPVRGDPQLERERARSEPARARSEPARSKLGSERLARMERRYVVVHALAYYARRILSNGEDATAPLASVYPETLSFWNRWLNSDFWGRKARCCD